MSINDVLPVELLRHILYLANEAAPCGEVCHFWRNMFVRACTMDPAQIDTLLKRGSLSQIKWIARRKYILNYEAALGEGHLRLLQWLYAYYADKPRLAKVIIARNGHLHVMIWLETLDILFEASYAAEATLNGHLYIIKWMCAQGFLTTRGDTTLLEAAKNGHTNVLLWFKKRGYKLSSGIGFWAARRGHLDIVKWQESWTAKSAAPHAAHGGQLRVLKWALANGALHDNLMFIARCGGHEHIIRWLGQQYKNSKVE